MSQPWHITLFGGLRVQRGEQVITRFKYQKVGGLLAYLAYFPHQRHARDILVELFWPESSPRTARNNLSVALSSLRRQLEPPGTPAGSVLCADRYSVGLNPEMVTTDVAEFEQAALAAEKAADPVARAAQWGRAIGHYAGRLLPGYYEDWIAVEQERLAGLYFDTVSSLVAHLEQQGDLTTALRYARQAVTVDPLYEETHHTLMRLLVATGQPGAALQQFKTLERLLDEEMGETPSAPLCALARQIEAQSSLGAATDTSSQPSPPHDSASDPLWARSESPALLTEPQTDIEGAEPQEKPAREVERRASLPVRLTRFFGREQEIGRLVAMLHDGGKRLVTVTGAGGTGKTRLAIEAADCLSEPFGGAVWFVPLADISDPNLIADTILGALSLPRSPQQEALEQVSEALVRQPSLLVLDNFEHLVEKGAEVIQTLLARVPSLSLLVTSRHVLSLSGEQQFALSPLPTPGSPDTPERLMEVESIQLFVDRAQLVMPHFQVTTHNASAVAALCERLEGIPLAIELAASRVHIVAPSHMLAQLENRFDFLTTRKRDVSERHRSLRAAIEWSYRLLSPELQCFFARLSVFRGGWTAEAAKEVCVEPNALDYLAQLRECSLVLADETAQGIRFRMLETLREYAYEQLSVEEKSLQHQRHLDYFLRLAEEAEPELNGPNQTVWLARLDQEHDNLRAIFLSAPEEHDQTINRLRIGYALRWFWYIRGHLREGRTYLADVLAQTMEREPTLARVKALLAAGMLAWAQSDYDVARAYNAECLAASQESGDRELTAHALSGLGLVASEQGDYEKSRDYTEQSLVIYREVGDKFRIAASLHNLGALAIEQGESETARRLCEESLALYRELGNRRIIGNLLENLGMISQGQSDVHNALTFYEEALTIAREHEDRQSIARVLTNLANLAFRQSDFEKARSLNQQALSIRRELGDRSGIANSLNNLGRIVREEGDYTLARQLAKESLSLRRELGERRGVLLAINSLANLARAEGQTMRATRLSSATTALRTKMGILSTPADQKSDDEHIAHVRALLSDADFEAALNAGSAMTWEEAIRYALEDEEA